MTEYIKGLVLYTDGGARPSNPGKMGWGMHGYKYTTEPSKRGSGLAKHNITDLGYIKESDEKLINSTVTKVTPLEYYDFFGTEGHIGTCNQAEVDALRNSLMNLKDLDVSRIHVLTDSSYLVHGVMEYIAIWKTRNWVKGDGSVVPNKDSWIKLDQLIETIRANGIAFTVAWLEGHVGNFGNLQADSLATLGVSHGMKGKLFQSIEVSPAQGYWKKSVEKHPFLGFRKLYFNNRPEHNVPGVYYLADPGGDEFVIGRKLPAACYSIVQLKEPDQVLETIRTAQCDINSDTSQVVVARLDKVYSPDVFHSLTKFGGFSLMQRGKRNTSLDFIDDKPITVVIDPPGLVFQAVTIFEELNKQLEEFKALTDTESLESENVTDITSYFYDISVITKNGKTSTVYKLKKEFNLGADAIKKVDIPATVNNRKVVIPLTLGLDSPERNQFKQLEDYQPRVSLITWCNGDESYRFCTIVKTEEGVAIWANYYANRQFF